MQVGTSCGWRSAIGAHEHRVATRLGAGGARVGDGGGVCGMLHELVIEGHVGGLQLHLLQVRLRERLLERVDWLRHGQERAAGHLNEELLLDDRLVRMRVGQEERREPAGRLQRGARAGRTALRVALDALLAAEAGHRDARRRTRLAGAVLLQQRREPLPAALQLARDFERVANLHEQLEIAAAGDWHAVLELVVLVGGAVGAAAFRERRASRRRAVEFAPRVCESARGSGSGREGVDGGRVELCVERLGRGGRELVVVADGAGERALLGAAVASGTGAHADLDHAASNHPPPARTAHAAQ